MISKCIDLIDWIFPLYLSFSYVFFLRVIPFLFAISQFRWRGCSKKLNYTDTSVLFFSFLPSHFHYFTAERKKSLDVFLFVLCLTYTNRNRRFIFYLSIRLIFALWVPRKGFLSFYMINFAFVFLRFFFALVKQNTKVKRPTVVIVAYSTFHRLALIFSFFFVSYFVTS